VSRTRAELQQAVAAAEGLPFGTTRSTVLEQVVAECDALGDERLGIRARLSLITAYCYGGEPLKRFAPFAWLLARHDEHPEWFDRRSLRSLLWCFKWMTVGMLSHPAVPLARVETALADMAERYAAAGEGAAPYLGCRFVVTQHVHGPAAAQDAYLAWVRAPRTELSDCQGCEPTVRAAHLQRLGRTEDVVREAAPVLAQGGCREQPQFMISIALGSLLASGRVQQAAQEHLRGVRLLRGDPGATEMWARHVHVCGRSGRLLRGLDLLEERLHEVRRPPTPEDGMWLAAAGARLLSALADAGLGDTEVIPRSPETEQSDEDRRSTVAELAEQLTGHALATAALFDARNGTRVIGEHVEEWLQAEQLPDLPIDAARIRHRGLTGTGLTAVPGWRPDGDPGDPDPSPPPTDPFPAVLGTADAVRSGAGDPVPGGALTSSAADGGIGGRPGGIGDVSPTGVRSALDTLVRALATSSDTGVPAERTAVLVRWRELRERYLGLPADHPDSPAAARMEAALALEELRRELDEPSPTDPAPGRDRAPGEVDQAVRAARAPAGLLRTTGQIGLAVVHEQVCLTEQARTSAGLHSPRDLITMTRLVREAGELAEEAHRNAAPADAGCAHLRHHGLLRWLGEQIEERSGTAPAESAATLGESRVTDPGLAAEAAVALERGLAAFDRAGVEGLTGYQRACWALLLLARSEGLDGQDRVEVLLRAYRLLPEGTRHGERALVGRELATALAASGSLVDASEVLGQAAEDATTAGDLRLLASTLSQAGMVRRHLGMYTEAIDALTRAVPVWEQLGEEAVADRTRFDLAWSLMDDGRPVEAAEVAESTLAAVEAMVSGDPPTPRVVFAGLLAYCAAVAAHELGDDAHAVGLAERSAHWHELAGNTLALAESLQLAAECDPDRARSATHYAGAAAQYRACGETLRALTCLRARTMAVVHADGLDAARAALAEAAAVLDRALGEAATEQDQRDRTALEWQQLALADQAVRVLATAGAQGEALAAVDGLAESYRELGDDWSARDVVGLRCLLLDNLGRGTEAVDDLRAAAQEAQEAGDVGQARILGSQLAALLDSLGRPAEADVTWKRFRGG
jgi:tetratricopeptide (TPR) repeat protein